MPLHEIRSRVTGGRIARVIFVIHTSRSQLDRILDPDNDRIQLATLIGAAEALGRRLRIELV